MPMSSGAHKRTLVTGGAGFLGSHLCVRLLEEGHHVVCVDNLLTGSMDNIEALQQCERFRFIEHDVNLGFDLALGDLDEIYNLACPASPIQYQKHPLLTTRTCIFGAFHVLELARTTSARVFQASTSEVYGDPLVHPQKEGYWGNVNPIGLRSCYEEGKRCAESIFFDYHRQHGVSIKIARIFNTYGPRMLFDDGRVISNFIVQALSKQPITIYGDGTQTRSFCYVDDLVEGIVRLMRLPDDEPGPLNLGNPRETTIHELAALIVELCGTESPLVFKALPSDDPQRRRPDLSQTRAQLGWFPKVGLEEGLKATIKDFQSRL